jgi:hypothetical protein
VVRAAPLKKGWSGVDAGKIGHYVVPSELKMLSSGHYTGKERHDLEQVGQLVKPSSGRQAGKKGHYWVLVGQRKELASGHAVREKGRYVVFARQMEKLAG